MCAHIVHTLSIQLQPKTSVCTELIAPQVKFSIGLRTTAFSLTNEEAGDVL